MAKLNVKEIGLDKIDISLWNIRLSNREQNIDELAESIKKIELQQPIVVSDKGGGRYELISGQRRFLAYRKLYKDTNDPKWKKIPAIIIEITGETDAIIKSFSENIHRLELTEEDKMQVAAALLAKLGDIGKVAKHLGVSTRKVRNWLGFEGVYDPLKKMVNEQKLTPTDAKRITKITPDENRAVEIAEELSEIKEIRGRDKREIKKTVIDIAKDNPDKSVQELAEVAKKRPPKKITVNLTERVADALKKASDIYDSTEEEIAVVAIEEWLGREGFMDE